VRQQSGRSQREQRAGDDLQPFAGAEEMQIGQAQQMRQHLHVAAVDFEHVVRKLHRQQMRVVAPLIGVRHARRKQYHHP
jgi:hypothetical protein